MKALHGISSASFLLSSGLAYYPKTHYKLTVYLIHKHHEREGFVSNQLDTSLVQILFSFCFSCVSLLSLVVMYVHSTNSSFLLSWTLQEAVAGGFLVLFLQEFWQHWLQSWHCCLWFLSNIRVYVFFDLENRFRDPLTLLLNFHPTEETKKDVIKK